MINYQLKENDEHGALQKIAASPKVEKKIREAASSSAPFRDHLEDIDFAVSKVAHDSDPDWDWEDTDAFIRWLQGEKPDWFEF